MKVFLVLLFLFLLLGSSQESSLSHKRLIRGLNTTLQTNFNGTYQRKNPCTNTDIETTSYIASHEFHHHTKEDNWNNYTDKCSAIINSFLRAVGNLIRFNGKQNGIFNFHINTSISQKQDEHCMPDEKHCNSLPTITIEAKSCELLPPLKSFFGTEGSERKQAVAPEKKYLFNQDDKTVKTTVGETTPTGQNPAKIISEALASLKPIEKAITNPENYSTTPQCPIEDETTLIPPQDETTDYDIHNVNEGFTPEDNLEKEQNVVLIIDGPEDRNFTPRKFLEYSTPAEIPETIDSSQLFFNDFSQNTPTANKPELNSGGFGTSTTFTSKGNLANELGFTTPVVLERKDEFTTAYGDEKSSTECKTSSSKAKQLNTFGFENSFEHLTSSVTPAPEQIDFSEGKFPTPETQNIPYYNIQRTVSKVETTPQPIFVDDDKLLSQKFQPSNYDSGEPTPDFQLIEPFSNVPSALESELADKFEKPFDFQRRVSVGLEKATELPESDLSAPANYDKTKTFLEKFQPVELIPDQKTRSSPFTLQASDATETLQFVSEPNGVSSQKQPQTVREFDKTVTAPYSTFSKPDQQNVEMLEDRNIDSPNSKDLMIPNQLKASPYPLQFDDHLTNPPEVQNTLFNARSNKPPEMPTNYPGSQARTSSTFPDYETDEPLISTTSLPVYSHQFPSKPFPYNDISTEKISKNSEAPYLPESDQKPVTSYSDSFYDDPPSDSFLPTEENYKQFSSAPPSERSVNSFAFNLPFSESNPKSLSNYYKQKSDKNINEPVRNLNQQLLGTSDAISPSSETLSNSDPPTTPPLDLATASYNHPEVSDLLQSTVVPKILPPDSIIDANPYKSLSFETKQQLAEPEATEEPRSNFEVTYAEDTFPAIYKTSPRPKFYDSQDANVQSESAFMEYSPFQFPQTVSLGNQTPVKKSSSLEYVTTPLPNQIPTPSVLTSGTSNNQPSDNKQSSAYFSDFQPKPQSPLTNQAAPYLQQSQNFNSQPISDDYSIPLPFESFSPKSKPITAAYSKQQTSVEAEPNRNLALNYPDQVTNNPEPHTPASYSEQITSDGYQNQNAPFAKDAFSSLENFPESLTKYSPELPKTSGFDNDKTEVNSDEQIPLNPDSYLTLLPSKVSDIKIPGENSNDFYFPVTNEPDTNEKPSFEFFYKKESPLDNQFSREMATSPNSQSFTIYNSPNYKELTEFQDKSDLINDQPSLSIIDGEFSIKNHSPSSNYKNDASFSREQSQPPLNLEITSDSEPNRYAEQVPYNRYGKQDFQPLLLTTREKQNSNDKFEEFSSESFTTPSPPVTYVESDFYSSNQNPSDLQNPQIFSEAQEQLQDQPEAFEPITYTEAPAKFAPGVHERQNDEGFFDYNSDYLEQSSASRAPLQEENRPSFIPDSQVVEDQNTQFLTSSDQQNENVVDSAGSFRPSPVNYMKGHESGLSNGMPSQFPLDKKVPEQLLFLDTETTPSFESEYLPTVKPTTESGKLGLSKLENFYFRDEEPQKTFDRALKSNHQDYSTGFLPTTHSVPSGTSFSDSSKTQSQSFLSYSDAQFDSDLKSQSITSPQDLNQPEPADSVPKSDFPVWTEPSTEFTEFTSENQTFPNINTISDNTSNGAPNSHFTQPLPSETENLKFLNQEDRFNPSFSQADLKPLTLYDQAPSTASQSQFVQAPITTEDPSTLELLSRSQPPVEYYNEQIPSRHSPKAQSLVSMDIKSTPQPQPPEATQTEYLTTSPTLYPDSTAVEDTDMFMNYSETPFSGEAVTRPVPQVSSYSEPQYLKENNPIYSPPFVSESQQVQRQSFYENFSDNPIDNTLLSVSRTFDDPETTNQIESSLQPQSEDTMKTNYNLDLQQQPNFKGSLIQKFDTIPYDTTIPTSLSYSSNRQSSVAFDSATLPLLNTDDPSYKTLPSSDLKSEEFMMNSNQYSQENTGSRETLLFGDNVSLKPQAATAAKDEEIVTTQYHAPPAPNASWQTTLNYGNQLSNDNPSSKLPEIFTNQQHLVTSDPDFISKTESSSSVTSSEQISNDDGSSESFFLSGNEMPEHQLSTTLPSDQTHQTKTKETFEQEIITTDYPIGITPQGQVELPLISLNSDSKESFLPYNNQLRSQALNFNKPSAEYPLSSLPQHSTENFNSGTYTLSQFPNREVNSDSEKTMDPSQINQSQLSKSFAKPFLNDERPESFLPYDKLPSVVPEISDDTTNAHEPQRRDPESASENYSNQFTEYKWESNSNKPVPDSPYPVMPKSLAFNQVSPKSQVPPEHLFYSDQNQNYNTRELFSDPQVLPLSQGSALDFNPSFEPKQSYIPETQFPNFASLSKSQTTDSRRNSPYEKETNTETLLSSFTSSNNARGEPIKVLKEVITADVPTAITESPAQEQLAYADKLLNNNKKFSEFQPLTSAVGENYGKRFEPPANLYQVPYDPPISDFRPRSFSRYSINNPQQVEPLFEKGFLSNVSYPDFTQERTEIDQLPLSPISPEEDYKDYDQVFPNPRSNQRFVYDEAVSRNSQSVEKILNGRQQLFDQEIAEVVEKQPYDFRARSLQDPVIYSPDNEPSVLPPPPAEKEQHSNPLLQTLESHMTLPFQKPSPAILNDAFLPQTNHQNEFRDIAPGPPKQELPNSPPLFTGSNTIQDFKKQPQFQTQPVVSDITNPSNNPGEDRTSNCRLHNRGAIRNPLLCPFDPLLKGNMTAPSYYILISKFPIDDNGDESFQVEKVYLGDGTPLNCSFSSGETFTTSLYTPVPFSAADVVKFQTKSDTA